MDGSLREYKTIIKHAQNPLRGILSINTDRWITCEELCTKLCMADVELVANLVDIHISSVASVSAFCAYTICYTCHCQYDVQAESSA